MKPGLAQPIEKWQTVRTAPQDAGGGQEAVPTPDGETENVVDTEDREQVIGIRQKKVRLARQDENIRSIRDGESGVLDDF